MYYMCTYDCKRKRFIFFQCILVRTFLASLHRFADFKIRYSQTSIMVPFFWQDKWREKDST